MGVRIDLRNVSYKYPGDKRTALKGISLTLESGCCIGVTGPNGSGKTTLLKIISLLYKPTTGQILYDGIDPWRSDITGFRRRVVHVHDKPIMMRGTVLDNLTLGLVLRNLRVDGMMEKVNSMIGRLGLHPLLEYNARGLSTGQRQLVAIARALVLDPDVLTLDEPYFNLDYRRRRGLQRVLDELREEGKLIVVSSHNILRLSRTCDRIIYLEDGKIVLEGPALEVARELLSDK